MGFFHSAAFQHGLMGAVSGWAVAARVDWQAFQSWKSFQDARSYNWGLAIWRWLQGAAIGGVTTSGLGGMLQ